MDGGMHHQIVISSRWVQRSPFALPKHCRVILTGANKVPPFTWLVVVLDRLLLGTLCDFK